MRLCCVRKNGFDGRRTGVLDMNQKKGIFAQDVQGSGPHIIAQPAPELVNKIRSGNHDAFELFYRMEYLNLVHFADSYLNNKDKARDIAQETMLSLWENRHGLDPEKNIRALVFTIARNKTLNEIRQNKVLFSSEEADNALALLLDASVEENINALDLSRLIQKEWDMLPQKARETFSMSRDEGLKNREIAEREGVSEKTVEYRMKTALDRFRLVIKNNIFFL